MKNGYVVGGIAGAIAGVADGIVSYIVSIVGGKIGLWTDYDPITLVMQFHVQTAINVTFGIFFGFAFVLVYNSIPRQGIVKGIIYGLVFYLLLSNLRAATFSFMFGFSEAALSWTIHSIFASVAYGSVLGYLYKKE